MLRTAPYPCLLLTVLILGCARHRGEMSESGALQCQSDCEVDVRNPTAEGMQVWAHVMESHSTSDPSPRRLVAAGVREPYISQAFFFRLHGSVPPLSKRRS